MRKWVFIFFVLHLVLQTLIISGAKPDLRLLVLFNYLSTIGLVLLSYWVWKDGERL